MTRTRTLVRRFAVFSVLAAAGTAWQPLSSSADWEQFRGPSQNGVSSEQLPASFSDKDLKQLWTTPVGAGAASITVSGNRVFTMGNTGGKDAAWCFDAASGKILWKFDYPQELEPRNFEGGAAATPTVDGNRVYTVSHEGDLFCLDVATGKKIWYRHYQRDFGGKRPQWGYAGSPLVEGALLICDMGGHGASTVALDKMTGNLVWRSGDDESGYASPVVGTFDGKKTVVMFKASSLVGLALTDGKELWRTDWKTSYDVNAATPLVIGDRILTTSGYGTGCGLYQVSAHGITPLWRNRDLRSQLNSPVALRDGIYGIDGNADSRGALTCLDVATGAVRWKDKSIPSGSLVAAGDKLVILTGAGELVIGEPSASGFKTEARRQVLSKRCWAQPTVANGRIFCRNNEGALVALAY